MDLHSNLTLVDLSSCPPPPPQEAALVLIPPDRCKEVRDTAGNKVTVNILNWLKGQKFGNFLDELDSFSTDKKEKGKEREQRLASRIESGTNHVSMSGLIIQNRNKCYKSLPSYQR